MHTLSIASLVVAVSVCAACKHDPPPPIPTTTTGGQSLHVDGVPGVPNVDIHPLADAGGLHVQIGAARVDLPSNPQVPIPTENGN